jgi:uncharacterized OB-fold protein
VRNSLDKKTSAEYLGTSNLMNLPFNWSAGPYLGRWLVELKDNGKLWASRCPKCQRLLLPPRIICGICYMRAPEWPDWVELSGKGRLIGWERVEAPQMNPSTGKIEPEPYIHGNILLNEGVTFQHYLEEQDVTKLTEGARVEMVLKPKQERKGLVTDILYFRLVKA